MPVISVSFAPSIDHLAIQRTDSTPRWWRGGLAPRAQNASGSRLLLATPGIIFELFTANIGEAFTATFEEAFTASLVEMFIAN